MRGVAGAGWGVGGGRDPAPLVVVVVGQTAASFPPQYDGGMKPHAFLETDFCGLIEVGLCMRFETHLTHKLGWVEHFNHPDTAPSYISFATLRLVRCVECVVLFSLLYNECLRD